MATRRTPADASDHDLLIRIDTRLEVLSASVRENLAALNARLDSKANLTDLDPLRKTIEAVQNKDKEQDARIATIFRAFWIGVGVVGAIEFFSRVVWPLIHR